MPLNITNQLIANILSTDDASGIVPINFGNGNIGFDSNVVVYERYFSLGAGANVITLPTSPCTQVYIKNIDPVKTITVKWTPNGGAANNVVVLNIGAHIILWDNPVGGTTPGITSLTMTPSAAACLVEFLLGG